VICLRGAGSGIVWRGAKTYRVGGYGADKARRDHVGQALSHARRERHEPAAHATEVRESLGVTWHAAVIR
jgi:hypothetical protein